MKTPLRFNKNQDRSTLALKELMTAAPISIEDYSAIMRKRVAVRRMVEDAMEEARARKNSLMEG